jgi:hypothetical protein
MGAGRHDRMAGLFPSDDIVAADAQDVWESRVERGNLAREQGVASHPLFHQGEPLPMGVPNVQETA